MRPQVLCSLALRLVLHSLGLSPLAAALLLALLPAGAIPRQPPRQPAPLPPARLPCCAACASSLELFLSCLQKGHSIKHAGAMLSADFKRGACMPAHHRQPCWSYRYWHSMCSTCSLYRIGSPLCNAGLACQLRLITPVGTPPKHALERSRRRCCRERAHWRQRPHLGRWLR